MNKQFCARLRVSGMGRSIALAVVLLACSHEALAQWTTNGSNINNTNTGNVGIGTSALTNGKLIVQQPADSTPAIFRAEQLQGTNSRGGYLAFGGGADGTVSRGFIGFGRSGTGGATLFANEMPDSFGIRAQGAFHLGTAGDNIRMTLDTTGNVNIGTTTSTGARLYIYGGNDAGTANGINLSSVNGSTSEFGFFNSSAASDYLRLGYWDGTVLRNVFFDVGSTGKVGIGTSTPTATLDVEGHIRSSLGFKFQDGSVQITAASGPQNIFKSVANPAGAIQFSAGSTNDAIRFEGSGGSSVSFDPGTKKVTIDSSGITSSPWTTNGSNINYASGNVGIGTNSPTSKLHVAGDGKVTGNLTVDGTIEGGTIKARYQDVAEWVPALHALPAGTVTVLNPNQSNQVMASAQAYDTRVAGVVSEQPGITLGESGTNKVLVATTGRVRVKVDASRGPIRIGDLLVTSDLAGVAMKSEPLKLSGVAIHRPGTLIGKALEPLEKGSGTILVLLSLQ